MRISSWERMLNYVFPINFNPWWIEEYVILMSVTYLFEKKINRISRLEINTSRGPNINKITAS